MPSMQPNIVVIIYLQNKNKSTSHNLHEEQLSQVNKAEIEH